ncbi:acylphosphatase [Salinicoccus sp. CNSTN-B1]
MEIPSIPEDIRLTRFILMAEGFPKSFLGWVQSTAVKSGVSGSVRKLSEKRISLVLGGSREDINAFTTLLRKKCRRFKHPVKFTRKKRVTPVMQGFNIIENPSLDPKKVKSLMQENKKLKKEIAALKKTRPDTSKNNYRKFTRRLASVRKRGQ